eukprot:TRINITY_DN10839_c0_g1_i1.p1 TRINITY_DN10839_c0_g1~~TRINITY_DN10839_c0_g1_i1.p1  ORF type:complete len:139 (+),score=34.09 TRINITY_DN10839_c0_g1_i1:49-417(+)
MGSIGSTSMKAFYLIAALLTIAFSPLNGQDVDAGPMDQQEPRYAMACPLVDIDFYGYDIDEYHGVASWHDCGIICNLTTACKFWTWNNSHGMDHPDHHRCLLKSSDQGLVNGGGISGQKGCM